MKNKTKKLYPPATIGVVGGGQLGRMFAFAAKRMGYNVIVLDPKDNSPAGQVCDGQVIASFDDFDGYLELAKRSDVVTYEFEHINSEILEKLEKEGYTVIPSSKTLRTIQNKYRQKTMLKSIGVNVPGFSYVENLEELEQRFKDLGNKAILKSCTDGYDGKGNMIVKSLEELKEGYDRLGKDGILIEELIDFTKEVSILVAKSDDEIVYYPISHNVHKDSILIESYIPADIDEGVNAKIKATAKKIVDHFDDVGVFCIEFFVDRSSEVLVNEIAPRPHNSGHYTIEACATSQFEQLVRVVSGMPLGSTKLRSNCVMHNILGSKDVKGKYIVGGLEDILSIEDCHIHMYGKQETGNLRKIGHITVLEESIGEANIKAAIAMSKLRLLPNL